MYVYIYEKKTTPLLKKYFDVCLLQFYLCIEILDYCLLVTDLRKTR